MLINYQQIQNTGIHLAILNNIPKIVEILLNTPQVSINEINDADVTFFCFFFISQSIT
jgi:hypothetical protein